MKKCVFITGTNCVGKSALAWEIINRYGGVDRILNDVTYCKEDGVCLAGRYGEARYGGVDRILNDKGSSCTSRLAEVVEEGLKNSQVIVCEGSFMNSFGMNLINAMFKAESYLVVNLFIDPLTLYERISQRSPSKNGKRDFKKILAKQKCSMVAAQKWQSIGVKVLQINTGGITLEEETDLVIEEIWKDGLERN